MVPPMTHVHHGRVTLMRGGSTYISVYVGCVIDIELDDGTK